MKSHCLVIYYTLFMVQLQLSYKHKKTRNNPKYLLSFSKQPRILMGYEFIYLSQFTQAYNESVIQNHQIVMDYIANPCLVFTV